MPDASDPAIASVGLTRRELRERERMARPPLEVADEAAATIDAVAAEAAIEATAAQTPSAPAAALPAAAAPVAAPVATPQPLTRSARRLLRTELAEPALDNVTVADTDREIARPAEANAPESDAEHLSRAVSTATVSTPIVTTAPVSTPIGSTPSQPSAGAPPRTDPAAARSGHARRAASAPYALRSNQAAQAQRAARPTAGRARRLATSGVTIVAMAFVALMAVSTSLPAEALLSSADVQAAAHAAQRTTTGEPAQSLNLAGGTDTISVQRDGYESQTIAQAAAASGIRMEATFTNNPNGTIQWPFAVGVHIGDHFGYRDCAGCSANHGGQDFNPGIGAPIQAVADGVVSLAEDGEGSLGVHMIIDHMIDGKLVSSVYAHMIHGSMAYKVGDVVKVGQVIGKVGNTGMSTGPHLHFEIRLGGKDGTKVDPLVWLYANTN